MEQTIICSELALSGLERLAYIIYFAVIWPYQGYKLRILKTDKCIRLMFIYKPT